MADRSICIIGLGYVGLPLAHALAKKGYTVFGLDVNAARVAELASGHDSTNELSDEQLAEIQMTYSTDPAVIREADVVILAIPTPVDDENNPDLTLVRMASETVGKHMKKGAIICYESTVYPGTTEEICGPILEKESGMTCGVDFKLGYSPERINPGDKEHTIDKIMKIVSGQDEETLEILSEVYGSVVTVGIHKAPNIKVAEMAKAIENAQRDLNIAFVNEIAMLCDKVGIHTSDVLDAASTKWNFLSFKPGLVGGHCIGVDPYYLVEKARQLGMTTHVITAGRAINDGMGSFVASQITDALSVPVQGAKVLVLGLTFKENVPDSRNSKSKDVIKALKAAGCEVEAHDPFHTTESIEKQNIVPGSLEREYDAVALLVKHQQYLDMPLEKFVKIAKDGGVIYDLKSVLNREKVENEGRIYISL